MYGISITQPIQCARAVTMLLVSNVRRFFFVGCCRFAIETRICFLPKVDNRELLKRTDTRLKMFRIHMRVVFTVAVAVATLAAPAIAIGNKAVTVVSCFYPMDSKHSIIEYK